MDKQKHEPYYKELTAQQSLDSGYFVPNHDRINWKTHTTLPCTPINFLKKVSDDMNPAIIISTGAHCPMHEGHIEMMVNAEKYLTNTGYTVIGGYMSPGHDEYIKHKTGDNWMPIHDRLRWANDMIKDYQWLAIDPWEGVFAPGAVNFTSVVYRIQQYIKKFYRSAKNVKIFFVCGSDNARFIVPFENTDIGVVVIKRPGYDSIVSQYESRKSDNIYFCEGRSKQSSTEVRKTAGYREYSKAKQKQAYLRIHWNHIEKNVLIELRKWFSHVWAVDYEEQVRDFKQSNRLDKPVLNLDVETHHGKKLDISRMFDLYGQKRLGFTHRPGSVPLDRQIKSILVKDYFNECYLFDDDIFTGSTMDFVEDMLKKHGVSVKGRVSFLSGSLQDKEVLDAKDFLIAYDTGGLVSEFGGDLVRLPYMYPFVCPSTRASITDPLQFSINMWELNMEFWKGKETTIESVRNLHFLIKLNHARYETIYDVCVYYRNFLQDLKKYY